jgi:hypothetical protein
MKHSDKTFPCKHCDKIFKNKDGLKTHMESVMGTRVKRQCPDCGKYYSDLSEHIRAVHRGQMKPSHLARVKCRVCHRLVPDEAFEDHQSACQPDTHICSICSKSVTGLKQHMLTAHSEFKCGICDLAMTVASKMRDHIYEDHIFNIIKELQIEEDITSTSEEKKEEITEIFVTKKSSADDNHVYTCQLCYKEEKTRTNIFIHMRYHLKIQSKTGRKAAGQPKVSDPSICPDCGLLVGRFKIKKHAGVCTERRGSKPEV